MIRFARPLLCLYLLLVPAQALGQPCAPEDERESCRETEVSMMPGGFGAAFFRNGAHAEPFLGGGVHISPRLWSKANDRLAPSQGSFFLQAAILRSKNERHSLALFDIGGTLAFERNPSRRFLLPYFGGALGWLVQEDSGSTGYVYPLVGVHLFWHPNLMLALEGGYLFPFKNLDALRGVRASVTLRFSLY